MPGNPANELKDRLRTDLKDALRSGRKAEMSLLRSLLAAIDNAEAPPRTAAELRYDPNAASEIARLDLSHEQLNDLLETECEARSAAATEMDRIGRSDKAEALRAEAALARRYLS